MNTSPPVPVRLQIVAVGFLLYGIACLVGLVQGILDNHLQVDIGVFGIGAYFGLRRYASGWRTYALVCTWFALICTPIGLVAGLIYSPPAYLVVCGLRLQQVSPVWLSAVCGPAFLLALWQYRVLTDPTIRARFYPALVAMEQVA